MDQTQTPAYVYFSCNLRIIQARNVEFIKSTKILFARLYVPVGNNKIIELNNKNISIQSAPFWNESFNLDCLCPLELLERLKKQCLTLELRKRKTWGSNIIGKGEIPWKVILESQNMELKKWVKMDLVSGSDCKEGMLKVPQVEVEIKIRVTSVVEMEKQNKKMLNTDWNECGCKNGYDHHQTWCPAEALGAF
ncbi:uncharacterized protein [Cicer arietinum]|uniref:Uncharacterized protein LOC101494911 n=1 Tax=Cicer arietinum TaxID=3827 RepID=A0A1S2YCR9_CICAR|nr:uncharacterized protein LOC101494911 [Cicer arietinum]